MHHKTVAMVFHQHGLVEVHIGTGTAYASVSEVDIKNTVAK